MNVFNLHISQTGKELRGTLEFAQPGAPRVVVETALDPGSAALPLGQVLEQVARKGIEQLQQLKAAPTP